MINGLMEPQTNRFLSSLPKPQENVPALPASPLNLEAPSVNPASFFVPLASSQDTFQRSFSNSPASLRIVSNSDTHQKYKFEPQITTALKTEAAKARAQGKDVLTLNSGDNNVGPEMNEWDLTVRMLNEANYDAVTLGNHDLDTGSAGYAQGLAKANFPTLISNIEIEPGSSMARLVQSGKIKQGPHIIRRGADRYGVIGVTTPDLHKVVSTKAKLEGEEVESLADTIALVQSQVNDLTRQGVNKIVLLSHMGLDYDRQLAQQVQGIDVIVGGHSHEQINGITPGYNYVKSASGEPVLIVQDGKNGQWISVTDVQFDAQGRLVNQSDTLVSPFQYQPDPNIVKMKNDALGLPRPMATISTSYDCNGNDHRPDAVAQFVSDSVRASTQTDIALVRSPELRNNIDAGTFTDQDLKDLMPFRDPVVAIRLTGAELLQAFEKSAQAMSRQETHPGLLHPSGLNVVLDKTAGRVLSATVQNRQTGQWEALNPNKLYSVAVGEFVTRNPEFPSMAKPERVYWNSGHPLGDYMAEALQRAGAPARPIQFKTDNRLQIV